MKHFCHGATTLALLGLSLLASRDAAAHTLGVSQSDFVVQPDGSVEAELVFAQREALPNLVLDRNYDDRVSEDELEAARPDLERLVKEGIEVDAGGRACPASLESAELIEGDGLRLRARYACPAGGSKIALTFFFLSELKSHKHAARISAGSASAQKLLNPMNRFLSLDVPESARPVEAPRKVDGWRRTALMVTTAVFVIFMAGLFYWRWRARAKGGKVAHESEKGGA